jgi:hypothetical protein
MALLGSGRRGYLATETRQRDDDFNGSVWVVFVFVSKLLPRWSSGVTRTNTCAAQFLLGRLMTEKTMY